MKKIKRKRTRIVYHGTSPKNVKKILKEGILPSSKQSSSNWEKTTHKDKVYLTPSKYLAYEYGAFDDKLNTDILKVKIDTKDIDKSKHLSDPMIGKEEIIVDEVKSINILGVFKNPKAEVMKETLRLNKKRNRG